MTNSRNFAIQDEEPATDLGFQGFLSDVDRRNESALLFRQYRRSSMGRPYNNLERRRSSARLSSNNISEQANHVMQPSAPSTTGTFTNPNRSMLTSGQPTSSISASTAHASMSSPSSARDSRLAALTGSSTIPRRPTPRALQPALSLPYRNVEAPAEKDADDPTVSFDGSIHSRRGPRTLAALSSLFVDDSVKSPTICREGSYLRTSSGTHFTKTRPFEVGALAPHIYSRGLLDGKFSDITVHAFGTSYQLHRLILDRAPFFSTAFSGPWLEADSKEMRLDPADVDANITQNAFELALKRMYGCEDREEEKQESIGLFAVACWLEIDDLLEATIDSLLKQMTSTNLATYINLVTRNYYGAAGTRILTSAKAMLCRDGWRMNNKCWDDIPAEIVRDVVASDGFFVPGEWERWMLARRLLNRRLKALARKADITWGKLNTSKATRNLSTSTRPSTWKRGPSDLPQHLQSLYLGPEVTPLLKLLDDGIHYTHMTFEELQRIRVEKDILGVPILPEKVISAALWMQMELRQRIVNAEDSDLELSFVQAIDELDNKPPEELLDSDDIEITTDVETIIETDTLHDDEPPDNDLSSSTGVGAIGTDSDPQDPSITFPDVNIQAVEDGPRRFWVPTTDATFPIDGFTEQMDQKAHFASRNSRSRVSRHQGNVPVSPTAFGETPMQGVKVMRERSQSSVSPRVATSPSPRVAFTEFPPYRFSVEFPAISTLKESKRYYSHTVWYAGSLWNIYVQKKESTKGVQLGVYLHREKQPDDIDLVLAKIQPGHSVDQRIGLLERELENRRRLERRNLSGENTHATPSSPAADLDSVNNMLSRNTRRTPMTVTGPPHGASSPDSPPGSPREIDFPERELDYGTEDSDEDSESEYRLRSPNVLQPTSKGRAKTPALPSYVDARPTIKTYFKIYSPGQDGRALTVYESKPDKFNFSQSWGWKSSSLDLEDAVSMSGVKDAKDRRLCFMVVLGTV